MAHLGVYATLLEVTYKAGANVSAISIAQLFVDSFLNQAESFINITCRKVFAKDATAFALLPATTRHLLSDATSNLAAIYAISYDMSGFTSRIEAENMINTLWIRFQECIKLLKDDRSTKFIKDL